MLPGSGLLLSREDADPRLSHASRSRTVCRRPPRGLAYACWGRIWRLERGIRPVHANHAVAGEEADAILRTVATDTAGAPKALA